MFDLRRNVFLLYCAAVAVAATAAYLPSAGLSPASSPAVAPPPEIDGELSDVVSNVYAPDGARRYRTESATVRHQHDDGTLTLAPVSMVYYVDGARTMLLRSESGKVLNRGALVELNGAVQLDRPADGVRPPETVNARNVEVETGKWIATTDERVVVRRAGQRMTGRGMVADLKRGEIRLLDDVRVRHE